MSNYKSELQSNNTDLQSIVNQVDELGAIVSEQDTFISQIKSALRGSGGTTLDDIGVFTVDDTDDLQYLFIKGMTFGEWINSNMNIEFYLPYSYSNKALYTFSNSYNGILICPSLNSGGGGGMFTSPLSVDGTANTLITEDTIIEEINYLSADDVSPFE